VFLFKLFPAQPALVCKGHVCNLNRTCLYLCCPQKIRCTLNRICCALCVGALTNCEIVVTRLIQNAKEEEKSNRVYSIQTPFPSTRPDGGRPSISNSRDQNSEDDGEDPGFYNVCPCCKCARRTKPSVRLHTTIDLHIQKNKISTKFEVSCIWFHLHAKV
jgi:hypothetical protein